MGAQGTATLNFGATPAEEAFVDVAGQAGFVTTSHAEAFWMRKATGDNNADEHEQGASLCPLVCEYLADGSFRIWAKPQVGYATGQFTICWVWN